MVVEKFLHLLNRKPQVGDILKTPVELVDDEHLFQLGEHFRGIQKEFGYDEEIVLAAGNIIDRIDKIIEMGGNSRVNKEIRSASADDYDLGVKKVV